VIRSICRTLVLAAAALATASAPAQVPEADSEDITVTARRQALTTTLRAVLAETGFGQLGRFEAPVCPGVTGLPENHSAVIVGIIRANARDAGLKLQEEGCRPNAIAVFVSDPRALLLGWKARDRSMFGTMTEAQIDALAATAAPVLSWRVVETRRYDGAIPDRVDEVDGQRKDVLMIRNALASRNEQNVRQDIMMSVAVIRSSAIRGKTLQQLADVATLHLMLDLAPDAPARAGPDSILTLFEDRPRGAIVPDRLSAFDRGMLKGLYGQAKNNFDSHRQRSALVRQINREVDSGK